MHHMKKAAKGLCHEAGSDDISSSASDYVFHHTRLVLLVVGQWLPIFVSSSLLAQALTLFSRPLWYSCGVQVIHIEDHVLIRSFGPIRTVGVHFIVHRLGKLTFSAPAVDIRQNEVSCRLFYV